MARSRAPVITDMERPFSLSIRLVLLAIVSGAVGSLGAAAFRESLFELERVLHGNAGHLVAAAQRLSWWQRLLFPCIGGVIAGYALQLGSRWAQLSRHIEYLEVIAVGHRRIDSRSTLVRSVSSMISVATGASIGREGAMVQVMEGIADKHPISPAVDINLTAERLSDLGFAFGLTEATDQRLIRTQLEFY